MTTVPGIGLKDDFRIAWTTKPASRPLSRRKLRRFGPNQGNAMKGGMNENGGMKSESEPSDDRFRFQGKNELRNKF